jgi:hypothetical protein
MHLYWRIKEELWYLGEVLIFHDPRFTREYNRWFQRRGKNLAWGTSSVTRRLLQETHQTRSLN